MGEVYRAHDSKLGRDVALKVLPVDAAGIVELLTTNLTQLERNNDTLRVVPASDVRRYDVASAKEARQAFGVGLSAHASPPAATARQARPP